MQIHDEHDVYLLEHRGEAGRDAVVEKIVNERSKARAHPPAPHTPSHTHTRTQARTCTISRAGACRAPTRHPDAGIVAINRSSLRARPSPQLIETPQPPTDRNAPTVSPVVWRLTDLH